MTKGGRRLIQQEIQLKTHKNIQFALLFQKAVAEAGLCKGTQRTFKTGSFHVHVHFILHFTLVCHECISTFRFISFMSIIVCVGGTHKWKRVGRKR